MCALDKGAVEKLILFSLRLSVLGMAVVADRTGGTRQCCVTATSVWFQTPIPDIYLDFLYLWVVDCGLIELLSQLLHLHYLFF